MPKIMIMTIYICDLAFIGEDFNRISYLTFVFLIFQNGKSVGDKLWKWTSWTLILNKLTVDDSGMYTCIANSTSGKVDFSIQLLVTGKTKTLDKLQHKGFVVSVVYLQLQLHAFGVTV